MSKKLLDKYPLQDHFPKAYKATSGWQVIKNHFAQHNGRDYSLITVERRNRSVAKICLTIVVTLLSLGLIFAFASGRRRIAEWWLGIERGRFSLVAPVSTPRAKEEMFTSSSEETHWNSGTREEINRYVNPKLAHPTARRKLIFTDLESSDDDYDFSQIMSFKSGLRSQEQDYFAADDLSELVPGPWFVTIPLPDDNIRDDDTDDDMPALELATGFEET